MMLRLLIAGVFVLIFGADAFAISGATLFKQHCDSCHPDGGNIINQRKTLNKKDMDREGIKDWKGVVNNMRNPGPGMTRFDVKTIPDKEAKAIAEYVIKTFK